MYLVILVVGSALLWLAALIADAIPWASAPASTDRYVEKDGFLVRVEK